MYKGAWGHSVCSDSALFLPGAAVLGLTTKGKVVFIVFKGTKSRDEIPGFILGLLSL